MSILQATSDLRQVPPGILEMLLGAHGFGEWRKQKAILPLSGEFQEALGSLPGTAGHQAYLCTFYLSFPRGQALSLQNPLKMHLPRGGSVTPGLGKDARKKDAGGR